MSDSETTVRASIVFGDSVYLLAPSQDYDDLKRRIEAAVHSGGAFVEFVVAGNRAMSALVTGAERILLALETVPDDDGDEGDTEDVEYPFGTFVDEI